ncbi:hypothetical protein CRYUN_Cryun01aG0059200 [Craigia yunnanensis]
MEKKHQFAMLASILYIVNGDWSSLLQSPTEMDVVRPGTNIRHVTMDLEDSLGEIEFKDGIPDVKFSRVLGKIWAVALKYHFHMPPYYTLVLRSLASLEGLAVAGNPSFKTFEAAYLFVVRKLLTENSAETRKILHSGMDVTEKELKAFPMCGSYVFELYFDVLLLDHYYSAAHRKKDINCYTMSSPGTGIFSGFTKLCKGLAVILIGGHIVVQLLPSSVTYLALIPARTIPFGWNLITSGYIEQSVHGVVVSTLGLLFMGKLLEPIWGSKEFLKFIFVINFLTSVCVFITAIALYYITRQENYLYIPLSGFHGVLAGFLVGIKQIVPDQELSLLKIKAKWMPSLMLLLSLAISFFTTDSVTYLPTLIFGTYMGWIYLRYLQRKPEAKRRGDPSEDFAVSTFFPEFLRPIIDPIASIVHRMLCGKSEASTDAQGYTLGGAPLPGSDPIESSRRRERGARALEERLSAEKLAAGRNSEESQIDGIDNV